GGWTDTGAHRPQSWHQGPRSNQNRGRCRRPHPGMVEQEGDDVQQAVLVAVAESGKPDQCPCRPTRHLIRLPATYDLFVRIWNSWKPSVELLVVLGGQHRELTLSKLLLVAGGDLVDGVVEDASRVVDAIADHDAPLPRDRLRVGDGHRPLLPVGSVRRVRDVEAVGLSLQELVDPLV